LHQYRFIEVEEIHEPRLIVVVGALGLLVNIVGLFLFHGEYATACFIECFEIQLGLLFSICSQSSPYKRPWRHRGAE